MTLTLDLTQEQMKRLQRVAKARGVEVPAVLEDLIEHLPEPEVADKATLVLLDAWDAEAAMLTPEERAEAIAEWEEFKTNMNANRALEGRPAVFFE